MEIKKGTLLVGRNGMIVETLTPMSRGSHGGGLFKGIVIYQPNDHDNRKAGYTGNSWVMDYFNEYSGDLPVLFTHAIDLLETKLKEDGRN